MDKLNHYRNLIKQVLAPYVEVSRQQARPGVEELFLTDDEHGHYLWLSLGWFKGERLNSPIVYLRLKDGKIWLEEDWTDLGIADQLLEAGVPKEDIVLALHAPELRQYTEFAAA